MISRKKRKPVQVAEISSTTEASSNKRPVVDATSSITIPIFFDREPLNRKQLLVKFGVVGRASGVNEGADNVDNSKWHSMQYLELRDSENSSDLTMKAEQYAAKVLQAESDLYQEFRGKQNPGDTKWMKTITAGGTLSDQVAALTMLVQESPVHNIGHLRSLVNKVTKHSRREASTTVDTLKDLFTQELLPDRKLVPLKLRPLTDVESLSSGNKDTRDRRLILWYFESQLKELYDLFIRTIEKWCHDTVDATRLKAIRTLLDLLISKPEQEQFLLSSLVNKLGDRVAKVASKVVYYLLRLVDEHPNMKRVVADAVGKLIYRPNISPRAQHYAVCFLSQLTLKRTDTQLAMKLLSVYFNLFKLMVKKDPGGAVDNKMLAILLKGTNRAFPCCPTEDKRFDDILSELDTLYKVAAVSNFRTSVQTLLLLHQTLESSNGVSDRFYSALYRKLNDPTVMQSSSHKHFPLFFHLLQLVLSRDASDKRVLAFVKRLLQSALCCSPPFAVSALMLLSNLFTRRPALRKFEKQTEATVAVDEDPDEDEHFTDAHGPESDAERESSDTESKKPRSTASWVHRDNVDKHFRTLKSSYDPSHRNPSYTAADTTLLYEVHLLTSHFHPTVALFARNLLQGKPIEYPGDPQEDFTLIRFLDRFVYRNPKKMKSRADDEKGDETNQSGRARTMPMRKRKSYNPWGVKAVAVTSDDYISKREEEIPVDEQYLHRFMATAGRPNVKRKKKRGAREEEEDESDIESVASEEFDALLEKFEPGGKNEEFEVDFSKDMATDGKKKRRKRKADESEEDEDEDGEDLFDVDPDD